MAKKIELNKQTLRVLSSEEMEAVAGGLASELPLTPTGCHTTSDVCIDSMAATTTTTTTTTDPNA